MAPNRYSVREPICLRHEQDLVKEEFANGFQSVSAMYGEEHIANGTVRLVTLAPELKGARDAISGLVGAGVKVSAGYTNIGIKEAEVHPTLPLGCLSLQKRSPYCSCLYEKHVLLKISL